MFRRKPKWDEEPHQDRSVVPVASDSTPRVTPVEWSASGLITMEMGTTLGAKWESPKELTIIKKEIRLRQKALRLEKKLVSNQMTAIRTAYRQKTANRGPSIRGGGSVGRVFRTIDQFSRANDRSNREHDLAPLERAKADLDYQISVLDQFLIQIEMAALESER